MVPFYDPNVPVGYEYRVIVIGGQSTPVIIRVSDPLTYAIPPLVENRAKAQDEHQKTYWQKFNNSYGSRRKKR